MSDDEGQGRREAPHSPLELNDERDDEPQHEAGRVQDSQAAGGTCRSFTSRGDKVIPQGLSYGSQITLTIVPRPELRFRENGAAEEDVR